MARLYADENFPQEVVHRLRRYGHDILTVFEAGNANVGIGDAEVLNFAVKEQRAVITQDRRDFIQLHMLYQNNHQTHFGIVVCKYDRDVSRQTESINLALLSLDDLSNQLVRVTRQQNI